MKTDIKKANLMPMLCEALIFIMPLECKMKKVYFTLPWKTAALFSCDSLGKVVQIHTNNRKKAWA